MRRDNSLSQGWDYSKINEGAASQSEPQPLGVESNIGSYQTLKSKLIFWLAGCFSLPDWLFREKTLAILINIIDQTMQH